MISFLSLSSIAQEVLDDKVYLISSDISDFEQKLKEGYQVFRVGGNLRNADIIDQAQKWLNPSPQKSLTEGFAKLPPERLTCFFRFFIASTYFIRCS